MLSEQTKLDLLLSQLVRNVCNAARRLAREAIEMDADDLLMLERFSEAVRTSNNYSNSTYSTMELATLAMPTMHCACRVSTIV
jgi:hypothetical protein